VTRSYLNTLQTHPFLFNLFLLSFVFCLLFSSWIGRLFTDKQIPHHLVYRNPNPLRSPNQFGEVNWLNDWLKIASEAVFLSIFLSIDAIGQSDWPIALKVSQLEQKPLGNRFRTGFLPKNWLFPINPQFLAQSGSEMGSDWLKTPPGGTFCKKPPKPSQKPAFRRTFGRLEVLHPKPIRGGGSNWIDPLIDRLGSINWLLEQKVTKNQFIAIGLSQFDWNWQLLHSIAIELQLIDNWFNQSMSNWLNDSNNRESIDWIMEMESWVSDVWWIEVWNWCLMFGCRVGSEGS